MKIFNQKSLMIVGLLLNYMQLFATGVNSPVNVCTPMCGGNNMHCTGITATCTTGKGGSSALNEKPDLNAALDRVNWPDAETLAPKSLGVITESIKVTVEPPLAKSKNKKLYTFTPTQGPQANKQIKILLVAVNIHDKKQPADVQEALTKEINKIKADGVFGCLVKIYRKLSGEAQWIDMGEDILVEECDRLKDLIIPIMIDSKGIGKITRPVKIKDADGSTGTLTEVIIDFAVPVIYNR
jgi:hypothetical protein